MKSLTFILTTLLTTAALAAPSASDNEADHHRHHPHGWCGTCNPLSGQNSCDITTSCISTGDRFHCACRAGYKASDNNQDFRKQFRLAMPKYEFLVFTPESTECNTLCDDHYGASGNLCAEVPLYEHCAL